MNRLRVPFIRDGLIRKYGHGNSSADALKGLKLLDVGCGGGILTEALASFSADVTGIDPSEELIAIAREHVKENCLLSQRITYKIETIEEHSARNQGKYDAVILSEVIEHVNEQETFLKLCIDAVKPGGSIFLSTFNRTPLSYFWGIFLAEDVYKVILKNTHEWSKFISPQETQRIFETNDCKVEQLKGLLYLYSPWNTWVWTKSTAVTYIQHAVKNCN
ncbi:ubiquinone biosynthesis O-methyltransferase, mitochondrial-like [Lutzomyia longipalpis]|uniref:ubiquinone biosynthesis O-methyltransferase, mitochondrial-like n=1 Tax=Lutzomyia longipalpis TaxID=7200 RepID=UPI00248446D9|nr:ubiquinone biosynthesis O-methyltransferase, mitochondrial-like [Lutzomyia longipalpis]